MVFNLTTMRWTSRYRQTDPLNPDPVPIINRGPNLGLILGLSISLFGVIAIAGGVYLFRREKRKAARDYGKINNGKGINIDHNSPIGPSSHSRAGHPDGLDPIDSDISFGTLPASSAPLSYQNGRQKRLLTVSRSLNQNSGEYYSAKEGSGVDSASIRTATSGKYVHDSEEETASRKTRRRYQRPNYLLGHKIEMSSMGPQGNGAGDIVTSLNSNGDPTNISPACPHAIAPYAAPSAPPNPNIKKT
ncbi:hypothetical protein FBU30_008244 [Linnemannia zychae]|nr:hypothetical protein FBU30_008244 [Linnemannia zychae]